MFIWSFNLSCYLTFLSALAALIGDYVVTHSKLRIYKAVFDNATHSIIGGFSWFIVCIHFKTLNTFKSIVEIFACSLISSLIDLDHFFAAKSLQLKDATSLRNRPPLHCSTFPILTCILILLVSHILQTQTLKRIALIVLTAFMTHHTRDATRRGYWLFPYGSTPPLPYALYILITCLIPYLICYLQKFVTTNSDSVVTSFVI